MKKFISLVLTAVLLLGLVPFSAFGVSAEVSVWNGTATPFEEGSGTEADPYLIESAAQLAYLANIVNSGADQSGVYFKLTVDIQLNDEIFTFMPDTGLVMVTDGTNTAYLGTGIAGDTSSENTVFDTTASTKGTIYLSDSSTETGIYSGILNAWTPIGNSYSYAFSGIFDGDNHTISGIYINGTDYASLFGNATNATLKNVKVDNSFIRGATYAGGITTQAYKIENCYNAATVIASSYAGGIAAQFYVSDENYAISDCTNIGVVNGLHAGGIIGYVYGNAYTYGSTIPAVNTFNPNILSISNCRNTGNIYGNLAGGFIGSTYASNYELGSSNYCYAPIYVRFVECCNDASVRGVYAGGFIGRNNTSYSGNNYMRNAAAYFSGCYNNGDITGSDVAGGFIGSSFQNLKQTSSSSIVNNIYTTYVHNYGKPNNFYDCYNSGNINANSAGGFVGGICYDSSITTKQTVAGFGTCYNVGTVKASNGGGAFVGFEDLIISRAATSFTNCYYKLGCATNEDGTTIYQAVEGRDDSGVTSVSNSNMQKQDSFTGFDFDTVWEIDATTGYPYPILQGMALADPETCQHSYSPIETAPTCSDGGYTTYSCRKCFTSYVDDYVSATGHNYTAVVTTPTCTKQGYTTNTCSACGDSYIDAYTNALGHSPNKEATCTEDSICSVCGTLLQGKLGHNYIAVVTDPTCTQQGYTTHTCENCGNNYIDSYVRATGHDYTAETIDPTCTEQGYIAHTCKNCGDSYGENYTDALGHTTSGQATCTEDLVCSVCYEVVTEKLGHNYTAYITAPTCTQQGYTTYTCSACGDDYVSDYVSATGHSYSAQVTSPTCTQQGYTTYTCACGNSYVDDYVDSKGHSYSAQVTSPTCTQQGYTTYTCACGDKYVGDYTKANGHSTDGNATCTEDLICSVCGDVVEEKLGHDYSSVVTAPTCTKQGYTTYTCHCGDNYVSDYVKAKGHSYASQVTSPTCTEQGYTTYTCACGDKYVGDYTKANGHSAGEATCTEDSICSVCGDVVEEKLGHDYSSVVTAPTCDAQGYTTHTCNNCGDDYVDTYTSPFGHNYSASVTSPTCTERGYTTHTCNNCGDSYVDSYVKADGHDYTSRVTSPTCTERGYTTHTCHCGDSYVDSYVKADGHDYTSRVTSPTCTEQGYTTYTCHCGDSYVDNYVKANGHNHSSVVTAPTCTEKGYTTHTCDTCGNSYVDNNVSATGHTTNSDATCTADSICSVCGEVAKEKLGHNYIPVVTAPTCTEQGYTTHTCDNCGDCYIDAYTNATKHESGQWTVITQPQISVEGLEAQSCIHCGTQMSTRPIAALQEESKNDFMLGDVNMNGKIDMTDYILLKRNYFGTYDFDEEQQKCGDINKNDKIDMTDYILLKRVYFGTYTIK